MKAASEDAVKAFEVFASNPVGGLPLVFESLEKQQAIGVGIVFAVFLDFCVILGTYMALPTRRKAGIGDIFKLVVLASVCERGGCERRE